MKWKTSLFRKNDIRGIYGKDFDKNFAKAIGRACASYIETYQNLKTKTTPQVVVGHDSRLSSPELAQSLSTGLCEKGVEVLFAGLVSTPACFFADHFCPQVTGSIMVTASHNPSAFNGFKFSFNKETLCDEQIQQLRKLIQKDYYSSAKTNKIKTKIIPFEIKPLYVQFMKKHFSNLKTKKKIVIDCGNGSAGLLAQAVFKALEIKVTWLYETPDGNFPNHHPDPSLDKNLKDLQFVVKKNQADFGVCFDGDGDRLVIVGPDGRIFHGDETMSFFIYDLLSQTKIVNQKQKIVADVKCAPWFYSFLKKNQLQSVMWKSGHSLIRRKTLQTGALFGGEFSGHFFFCDKGYCLDDGVYSVLRLLRLLDNQTLTLLEQSLLRRDLLEENLKEFNTNEIRIPVINLNHAEKQLKKLSDYYQKHTSAELSLIDGVRVVFAKKAWGLARLSNTQSVWTFRFGGCSQKMLKQIQNKFYQLLNITPC